MRWALWRGGFWLKAGCLSAYSGQYFLDEVMRVLGEHLRYRWMAATTWIGAGNLVHPLDLVSKWKPIVIYSKGDWRSRRRWHDLLHIDFKEKQWHAWQQPLDVVERLVQCFSEPGELVVDPCGGGFTTALACRNLGRRFIGCDVDQECVLAGQERLAEEISGAGRPANGRRIGIDLNPEYLELARQNILAARAKRAIRHPQ